MIKIDQNCSKSPKIILEWAQGGQCLNVSNHLEPISNSFLRRHVGWSRENSIKVPSPAIFLSLVILIHIFDPQDMWLWFNDHLQVDQDNSLYFETGSNLFCCKHLHTAVHRSDPTMIHFSKKKYFSWKKESSTSVIPLSISNPKCSIIRKLHN